MAQANQRKKAGTPTKARAKKAPKALAKPLAKATATRKLATATKKTATPKIAAKRTRTTTARATAKKARATVATKARKTTTTKAKAVRSKATKRSPAVGAKRKQSVKRAKNVVLQVPPVVIDTTAAAAVAANLVLQHTPAAPTSPVPAHPTTQNALKRGSSAFRHAKESASNPVSRQLAHVFGPAPLVQGLLPTAFRNDRTGGAQKAMRSLNPHAGHFGVPRRAAG